MAAKVISFPPRIHSLQPRIKLLQPRHRRPLRLSAPQRFSPNRFDFERLLMEQWLIRFTGSATVSQETHGMRGYSALTAVRGFPSRRAVTMELGLDGETEAKVPLHDYGFKAAYRQAVTRNWLVMEVRTSLRWPKEELDQSRKASWGVGIGFEMFFGTDEFLARPVTF